MAKVLRWKEKLALVFVAVFLSMARAWPLGTLKTPNHAQVAHSRLMTGTHRRTAVGIELMGRRPYLRLARASLVPVALPLTAGAYLAMAGAPGAMAGAAAGAAAADGGSCSFCNTLDAPCCSLTDAACCDQHCDGNGCWTVRCSSSFQERTGGFTCLTCGNGTCPACF
ncbi:MAG: hypothetical protein ACRD11_01395 [Terriglobia bacterium]